MNEIKDLQFGIWRLLNYTRRLIHQARKKELAQYGLTTRRSAILEIATRLSGKATQSEIARQLFAGRHVISEQLTQMEKDGLIVKVRDLKRKNEVRVVATEKGEEMYRKAAIHQSISDAMSALTEGEIYILWGIMSKLRERSLSNLGLDQDSLNIYPPSDPEKL